MSNTKSRVLWRHYPKDNLTQVAVLGGHPCGCHVLQALHQHTTHEATECADVIGELTRTLPGMLEEHYHDCAV